MRRSKENRVPFSYYLSRQHPSGNNFVGEFDHVKAANCIKVHDHTGDELVVRFKSVRSALSVFTAKFEIKG